MQKTGVHVRILSTLVAVVLLLPTHAQAQTMVCRFLPGNAYFSTNTPEGGRNEIPASRYCPVRISMVGKEVRGEEICAGLTVQKAFRGTVVANPAYPGNVIVLWTNEIGTSAALWSISFTRKEVGVAFAFSAHYSEVGGQWLKCTD
jgi:hypothetical protein